MPDIAYITMRLGVRVYGKVVEAGTGSGSMTHSLARSVGPRGKVVSFEYHRVRYEKARYVSCGLWGLSLADVGEARSSGVTAWITWSCNIGMCARTDLARSRELKLVSSVSENHH